MHADQYYITHILTCCCVWFIYILLPLASSVIGIDPLRYTFPNNISEPYNITVTCTIHPESMADQCEVRAMDHFSVTKIGTYMYIMNIP